MNFGKESVLILSIAPVCDWSVLKSFSPLEQDRHWYFLDYRMFRWKWIMEKANREMFIKEKKLSLVTPGQRGNERIQVLKYIKVHP